MKKWVKNRLQTFTIALLTVGLLPGDLVFAASEDASASTAQVNTGTTI